MTLRKALRMTNTTDIVDACFLFMRFFSMPILLLGVILYKHDIVGIISRDIVRIISNFHCSEVLCYFLVLTMLSWRLLILAAVAVSISILVLMTVVIIITA